MCLFTWICLVAIIIYSPRAHARKRTHARARAHTHTHAFIQANFPNVHLHNYAYMSGTASRISSSTIARAASLHMFHKPRMLLPTCKGKGCRVAFYWYLQSAAADERLSLQEHAVPLARNILAVLSHLCLAWSLRV